jgi:hypothetical protein
VKPVLGDPVTITTLYPDDGSGNDVIIELAVGSSRSVELVEVIVRGTQIVLKIWGLEGDPEVSPENFYGALQRAIAMARKEIESSKKS